MSDSSLVCDLCAGRGWIRAVSSSPKACPRCNAAGERLDTQDDGGQPTRAALDPSTRRYRKRFNAPNPSGS